MNNILWPQRGANPSWDIVGPDPYPLSYRQAFVCVFGRYCSAVLLSLFKSDGMLLSSSLSLSVNSLHYLRFTGRKWAFFFLSFFYPPPSSCIPLLQLSNPPCVHSLSFSLLSCEFSTLFTVHGKKVGIFSFLFFIHLLPPLFLFFSFIFLRVSILFPSLFSLNPLHYLQFRKESGHSFSIFFIHFLLAYFLLYFSSVFCPCTFPF